MLKLFWPYVLAHAGRSIRLGHPVLVFIRGTTNLFEFVDSRPRYFKHFGRASKSGCRLLAF